MNRKEKDELKKAQWEALGHTCRVDYVRCEKCRKPVTKRAHMSPECSLWISECDTCSNRIEIEKAKITARFLRFTGDLGNFADTIEKTPERGGLNLGPDLYYYVSNFLDKVGF